METINLNDCKSGDLLVSRKGEVYVYVKCLDPNIPNLHRHILRSQDCNLSFADDGKFNAYNKNDSDDDIVKVISAVEVTEPVYCNECTRLAKKVIELENKLNQKERRFKEYTERANTSIRSLL